MPCFGKKHLKKKIKIHATYREYGGVWHGTLTVNIKVLYIVWKNFSRELISTFTSCQPDMLCLMDWFLLRFAFCTKIIDVFLNEYGEPAYTDTVIGHSLIENVWRKNEKLKKPIRVITHNVSVVISHAPRMNRIFPSSRVFNDDGMSSRVPKILNSRSRMNLQSPPIFDILASIFHFFNESTVSTRSMMPDLSFIHFLKEQWFILGEVKFNCWRVYITSTVKLYSSENSTSVCRSMASVLVVFAWCGKLKDPISMHSSSSLDNGSDRPTSCRFCETVFPSSTKCSNSSKSNPSMISIDRLSTARFKMDTAFFTRDRCSDFTFNVRFKSCVIFCAPPGFDGPSFFFLG